MCGIDLGDMGMHFIRLIRFHITETDERLMHIHKRVITRVNGRLLQNALKAVTSQLSLSESVHFICSIIAQFVSQLCHVYLLHVYLLALSHRLKVQLLVLEYTKAQDLCLFFPFFFFFFF